jgi:hypothetical protein
MNLHLVKGHAFHFYGDGVPTTATALNCAKGVATFGYNTGRIVVYDLRNVRYASGISVVLLILNWGSVPL